MNPNMGYRDLIPYLVAHLDVSTAAIATSLVLVITWIVMVKLNRPVVDGLSTAEEQQSNLASVPEAEEGHEEMDEEDVNDLIKLADDFRELDSKDPVAVKRFVQDLRTQQNMQKTMSDEERQHEQEMQQKQLNDIFSLMQEHQDKFGVTSFSQVEEQLSMYKK